MVPVFDAVKYQLWKLLCKLLEGCAAGVAQIHRHHMVHLDIKSMNFLVARAKTVALRRTTRRGYRWSNKGTLR